LDAQEFRKDFLEDVKVDAAATGEGSCASFVAAFYVTYMKLSF